MDSTVLAVDERMARSQRGEQIPLLPFPLHGVLNVKKPVGLTSHDVILRLRRMLGIQKIGHAGTLDPAATGVLPVLLGKGTKIADRLVEWEKEYRATLRLGQSTDTQDGTGTVVQETSTALLSDDQIQSAFQKFHGTIQQVPPMYSAVKVQGQPLYKAARKGKTIARNPRSVIIHEMEILDIRESDVDFRVVCSKGTYIRTLCDDIGKLLNVGGHLLWLERSRVGPLHVQKALDIQQWEVEPEPSVFGQSFLTIDQALEQVPFVTVRSEEIQKVINGAPISWGSLEQTDECTCFSEGQALRIRDGYGQLLALGRVSQVSPLVPGGITVDNVLVEHQGK